MAKDLRVQIIGDARSYQRSLQTAGAATTGFGSKLSRLGAIAGVTAGGTGIAALTVALRAGISEWTQGQRVAAQTAQVLKTTGGVANVTAKQVDALATAIQNKSGIDDEAIKTTENLLLGFTNIRNEVGKGNDIFNRATKIVTDYSVRTGKNASGAAIIFGKALQDPLKNMGALSRAVGGLSAAQKAQIKTMVESGNTIGAQKLLLAELEKRFGGAADAAGKTLPGQLDILRERFRNLAGQGVGVAIAKLQEMAPTILGIAHVIGNFMDVLAPLATLMFDVIVTPMKVIFALLRGDWAAAWDAAKKPVMDMVAVVQAVWGHLAGLVMPALAAVTGAFTTAWTTIRTLTTTAWTTITGAITTALNTIANLTRTILASISGIFTTAWNAVQTLTTSAWVAITGAITTALTAIGGVVTTAFGTMQTGVTSGMTAIANAMATAWNGIKAAAKGAWDAVIGFITSAVGRAVTEATAVGAGILRGVGSGLAGLTNIVIDKFQALWGWIKGAAGSAFAFAFRIGSEIVRGVLSGLGDIAAKVGGAITGGLKRGLDAVGGFLGIGSPSKYTRDKLGKPIGEGIALGATEGVRLLGASLVKAITGSLGTVKTVAVRGMNDVGKLIVAAAKKYGVDARAALAVAMGEGGIKFGAVGDSGHAFGPFQMNNAGGVLTGMDSAKADRYANSVEGINAALRGMAAAGARGKVGLDAITTIISKYERPLNVAASIQNAIAAFKTLGPGVASAIKSGGAAVTGAQTRILTGLVNLAKQYGPIIGIEQVRSIIRGLDASQPGFLAKAREAMAAFTAAARAKVVESTATFASAFNGLANAALTAFDAKMAAWKPFAQVVLDKAALEEQLKGGADALASAIAAIKGGGAAAAADLGKGLGEQLSNAINTAVGQIGGAKTLQALEAVSRTAQTQMTQAITAATAQATTDAATAVANARAALTAAQAGGDPDAVAAAQAALDTAVSNQKALEAAIQAEITLATGRLVTAETDRHTQLAATQREGLAKELADLKTFIKQHPEEWAKLGPAVQAILAGYNVKLQTAGHAWADKFGDGIKAGIPYAVAQARALAAAVAAVLPSTSSPLKPAKTGPLSFHPYGMGQAWASSFASGLSSGRMGNIVGAITKGLPVTNGGITAAATGGGAPIVNVYVTGSVTTENELQESIYRALERRAGRNGGRILAT